MKRLFFPSKTKEKKARFACAPHDGVAFTGPTIYILGIIFCGPYDTYVLQFFCSFFFKIWGLPVPVGGLLVSQVICPSLRLSSPRPQSTSTAPNSQQQEFDNKQQHHPPANSSTPNRPESITPGNCLQPGFTACSARESTSTEKSGPKLIGYTGTIS